MGHLIYGGTEHAIEDRMLAHVRAVAASKLRRGESFMLSWPGTGAASSSAVELWLSPSTPLQMRFAGSREPELSQAWLEAMLDMAASTRGLVLVGEDVALARAARSR